MHTKQASSRLPGGEFRVEVGDTRDGDQSHVASERIRFSHGAGGIDHGVGVSVHHIHRALVVAQRPFGAVNQLASCHPLRSPRASRMRATTALGFPLVSNWNAG